ncbi:MAG: head GIN domain-containing protein [Ginsengibacter sp.]
MRQLKFYIILSVLFGYQATFAQTTTPVDHFDKAIISPHVQVTFVEGNEESVTIENNTAGSDKLKIEVNNRTLRIYLYGAKEVTKNAKAYDNGYKEKQPLYNGTVVTAIVTYKTLDNLSIRGEETIVCKSPLKGDRFKLKIYGESDVILNEVHLGELQTTLYGESLLEIKSGDIKNQRYTAYGESRVNSLGINGNTSRITSYGESDFKLNVADAIKITSYGDANLNYQGNPVITKGLHIGDVHIDKID